MNDRFNSATSPRALARLGGLCFCVLFAAGPLGCESNKSSLSSDQAPGVPVSKPIEKDVTDFVDFTGRTDAVQSVDIRARVTGYLMGMPFKEGGEVKAGELLFEIDHRPYKAQLDQALGQVTLAEASLTLAKATYERDLAVARAIQGGISLQQLDQDMASVAEAVARVNASKASTEIYKINMGFTKVTSPIDGQVSRYYLTKGNLVNQDQTLLTTVVSLDPMYAYFDMDEPTLLRIRRAAIEGKIEQPQEGELSVLMGLQGEDGYPHKGTINFVNNQVNPTTGSISVRAIFPNPRPKEHGVRLLSPGMFVMIRMPIGQPHPAVLVNDRAVGSDQGLKYVYVVDENNKVQYRRVTTGPVQDDGLRVISEGLKADEWIVVGALQQVRPKMEIRPEQIPMPSPQEIERLRQ